MSKLETRATPLHAVHLAAGARMVDFAGWHMPVQYTGVIDEHQAVRTRVGLFDVSHMGEARVSGPEAMAFLQRLTCNDLSRLAPLRAQYTALTTPQGTFVDDLLIYRLAQEEFLLVLNAANTAKDLAWLEQHRPGQVEVADVSEQWALLALQGPQAQRTLQPLVREELTGLKYYGFVLTEVLGASCLVSRTGYTGEDGFEIYCPAGVAARLWEALMHSGAAHGILAAGLAARDTLRLEAKLALYGNDIDETTTVYEADLGWIVKLGKGSFTGREVLAQQAAEGVRRKLAGFEMRGRAIARAGHPALQGGQVVGRVTSGTFAPTLKKSIGLAYLPVELTSHGSQFEIDIRGRAEPAQVVPTPFYKRSG
jgi:aminomethyltransferase